MLVVGAGLAGVRTCLAMRGAGFRGRITLVGDEAEVPYDRPPLSKDPAADVDLRTGLGLDAWGAADEVRLASPASSLHVGAAGVSVGLPEGSLVGRAVVIATGARAVLPPGWEHRGVGALRTRSDAAALWSQAGPGARLVVVGGGWIGCEAAATAARCGADVDLLEAGDHLLPHDLPVPAAARVAGWLAQVGVRVHLGRRVEGIGPSGAAPVVRCGDRAWHADRVLVGLGVRPAAGWVGAGVARDAAGAVLVDPWGRSSAPGVLAVGDAAARWSPREGRHLSGGHWTEALHAPGVVGPVAARWAQDAGSAGGATGWDQPLEGPVPDPVPYIFSEVAGRRLQVLGSAAQRYGEPGSVIWRESGDGWTAFRLDRDARLRGLASCGRPRDVAAARRAMMSAGAPQVDADALADPAAGPAAMFPAMGG